MKYVSEFSDPLIARRLLAEIAALVTQPWALMEICGGQTHAIIRHGIDQLLPPSVELIHGPGCPVCVTPIETIDRALALARIPGVTLCSFGDMLRVPGTHGDLVGAKAAGADVRVVYSPLDALTLARKHPERQVVFFGIGFETTAPAHAMAIHQAHVQGITNFSTLVSHVLVPPAIDAIMASPHCRVQAFLAAGHVCAVMGVDDYHGLAARHHVPMVVTGFEPLDVLRGIRQALAQLERGEAQVENAYERAVPEHGNPAARAMCERVFTVTDQAWRGIGVIPASGWCLREEYRALDAVERFGLHHVTAEEPAACQAGQVLQGLVKPPDCPSFGTACTPRSPLGAPMVSSEGACAAYYQFRRVEAPA